jgi:hypothetical protein
MGGRVIGVTARARSAASGRSTAEAFDLDSLRPAAALGPQRAGLRLGFVRRKLHPIRRFALLSQLLQVAVRSLEANCRVGLPCHASMHILAT